MPRPGPRPYECVRRAWHSDRHHPIRGSLIQEIFRIANEIHGSATKKNKEWQEKLPVVVLRAEEIMYSKANSEAEYMDPKTLWDRVNDAINTIVRRDENTETGKFLQPCIEAALNLGCTPRRTSRSQRNSNPTCYLNSSTQSPHMISSCVVENTKGDVTNNNSPFLSYFSNLPQPTAINLTHPGSKCQRLVAPNNDCTTEKFLIVTENLPTADSSQYYPMKKFSASNSFSVYPLYYGNNLHGEKRQPCLEIPLEPISRTFDFVHRDDTKNLYSCDVKPSCDFSRADTRYYLKNPCNSDNQCDLSLSLGSLSVPCTSTENSQPTKRRVVEDVCAHSSRERSKFSNWSPQMGKKLSFYPCSNAYNPSDGRPSDWSLQGEYVDVEAAMRKRKAVFSHPFSKELIFRQPRLSFSHFPGP